MIAKFCTRSSFFVRWFKLLKKINVEHTYAECIGLMHPMDLVDNIKTFGTQLKLPRHIIIYFYFVIVGEKNIYVNREVLFKNSELNSYLLF